MSRYRPAAALKSAYITRGGWDALHAEQEALWKKRRDVVHHLPLPPRATARRTPNTSTAKKQLRELDRRIRYSAKTPAGTEDRRPPARTAQNLGILRRLDNAGNRVRQRDRLPHRRRRRIRPKRNWISVDSPMARALLKRRVEDEVSVETPGGQVDMIILAIDYTPCQP